MKKILLIFAGIIMIFSSVVLVPTAHASVTKFKDVQDGFWAVNEINYLTEKGIITGYPDGKFGTNDKITRLQAVTMILREKGITDYTDVANPEFVDVQMDDSGYEIIAKGVELGIIKGKVNKGQKIFDPSGKLTRAEMATIIVNAYALEGSDNVVFSDVPTTHWAYNAIHTLSKNKITTGIGNGKFGTDNSITRTEFAVMMARMLNKSFEPTVPVVTGKTYPDGWTAPVLKSAWSPNMATNYATLENELGFVDGGSIFTFDTVPQAIAVIGNSPTSNGLIPEAYRVPIVAKELFKLYFEKDYMTVWNYFDKNDIPDNFTANGRNVHALYDDKTGAIVLQVGRK